MTKSDLITTQPLDELTAQERLFCNYVAKGYSLTQSYRMSHNTEHLADYTVRRYASDLYTKANISTGVELQQRRMAQLADKAINRLEDIIVEGKEHNALEASKFVHEQQHGKARQTTEVIGKHILVTYDLSGGADGPVPQHILDELADD